MKKISLREARQVEHREREQRLARDQTLRDAEQSRLQTICDHGANLIAYNKLKSSKLSKLGRTVIQYHHHIEKEEQKRIERIAKERIQALKNDDEEAYMKLIDEAKDTRLTHLLKQTGQFLETLTKSVVDQQNESKGMASFGGNPVIMVKSIKQFLYKQSTNVNNNRMKTKKKLQLQQITIKSRIEFEKK
jgi:ATP-dependent helicase STH1/SNF2